MRFNPIRRPGTRGLVSASVITFAVAMSGCASGPDYQAPALPDAAAVSFVSQAPQFKTDIPLTADWWKLYDDPTLDALMQEALSANADLRVALANLDRAHAIYQEARGGLLPSTNVTAGASHGRSQTSWSGPGQAPAQWSYTGGLDISYEVDLFGRVRRDIEAARYDTDAIAAAYDASRVVVVAETARAYVDACTYGESVDVARSSVELARSTLDVIGIQERAGAASRLDAERAGVSLARAEAALPPAEAQRNAALFELAALMGRTPSNVPEAARTCKKVPDVANVMPIGEGLDMLRRRPDVREVERQLAADTARIGVAVADLYPRITLGASVSYLGNDSLKGSRAVSFALGPLISWTFPNTTAARSRIAQAKAQGRASLARFDGVVLTALKESEQSLSAYKSAIEQRDALLRARNHAENSFRLADQRYRSGSIGYLDILIAQEDLLGTKAQVVAADQKVSSARVSVFKALGGGWEHDVSN